jgi:hypothetical protein
VRELLAISKTLNHMLSSGELKPAAWRTLWWLTDNANVEKMLAKGSGKLRITRLVPEIPRKGRQLCYDVHPIWISRDNPFLQKADCLSKGINSDNWSVGREDFSHLEERFGPVTINLFATCENKKCSRFYSRSYEKENSGTEAFAQQWNGECIYAAPLVTFVMPTIQKAAASKLNGIIVVPLWKGAKFWTYAFRDSIHLNGLFEAMSIVRMRAHSWEISRKDLIGGKELQFLVLVIDVVCSASNLESLLGKLFRLFRKLFEKECDKC